MLERKKIKDLNDYFLKLEERKEKGVYFYRICGYSEKVGEFIKKYYDIARRTGVVIEGKIPNPDEKNLSFYNEIMGEDFQMNMEFVYGSLKNGCQGRMSSSGKVWQLPYIMLLFLCEKQEKLKICSEMPISSLCAGCIISLNAL